MNGNKISTREAQSQTQWGHTNIDEVMNNYKDIKSNRVLRGGAWISSEENLRVANRYVAYDSPKNMSRYDGFRCAVDIV